MTSDGRELVARLLGEHLLGGSMVVSDGTESETTELAIVREGATVVARGVFGELDANFTWASRAVLDADGLVVDLLEEDLGTKKLGAVWTVDVPLEVTGD